MSRIIVTSGSEFLDIDAWSGCVAYAELLNRLGRDVIAYSSAPINSSITNELLSSGVKLASDYIPKDDDQYVIIDVSEPEFLDPIVKRESVVEVIDHHSGYEDYWQDKIGSGAHIEFIGAAATLVYERWVEAGQQKHINPDTAKALCAGILDNTLNFKASVTTMRDKAAFDALSCIGGIDDMWVHNYFMDCQRSALNNLEETIIGDTKRISKTDHLPALVSQLAVWDSDTFISGLLDEVASTLSTLGNDWVLNLIDINKGESYFFSTSTDSQQKISATFGVKFGNNGVAKNYTMMLRKEILKQAGVRY